MFKQPKSSISSKGWQSLLNQPAEGISFEMQKGMGSVGDTLYSMNLLHRGQQIGNLQFMTEGSKASVIGSEIVSGFKGKGLGKYMYAQAFEYAKSRGAHTFTSDYSGIVSDEAKHVWDSLTRQGISKDVSTATRFGRRWEVSLVEGVMARGASQAAGSAGISVSRRLIQGARKMIHL